MMEGGTKLLPDSILMRLYYKTKRNPLFLVDSSFSAMPALVFPPLQSSCPFHSLVWGLNLGTLSCRRQARCH